jgi:hypothetical protein
VTNPFALTRHVRRGRDRGQALPEFAIALIPFVFLLMGIFDLGRGVYTNNGTAQAAREIARVTSVHQCSGSCTSATWTAEMLEVINAQKAILPGLQDAHITIQCVDVTDSPITVVTYCDPGEFIRVKVSMSFRLVTPLLPLANPFAVSSTAHVQVPKPQD